MTLGWFGRLGPQARRTFWASFGGNALDNLDFSVFNFLIPVLTTAWAMSRGEAGLIATSTIVSGALGGVMAGALADRFGRVRVLQLSILWFSVFTALCGFAQNPDQMLLARTLQGLGFGGELAVGAVLIGEAVRPGDRGKIMAGVASGYVVGAIAASSLFALTFALFPPGEAWRWAFWAGILPALFVLYIRRNIPEPEVFEQRERGALLGGLRRLFGPEFAGRTILAILLVAGATAASSTFAIWLPTWLKVERGLSVGNTSLNATVNYLGSLIGFLAGGYVIDRLGRRGAFRIFSVLSFIGVCAYLLLPFSGLGLLLMGALLGAVVIITGVGMTPYLTELFPTAIRGTGLGLCYSAGRGLGALSAAVVGFVSQSIPLGWAISIAIGVDLLIVIIAASLLPETAGKSLAETPA